MPRSAAAVIFQTGAGPQISENMFPAAGGSRLAEINISFPIRKKPANIRRLLFLITSKMHFTSGKFKTPSFYYLRRIMEITVSTAEQLRLTAEEFELIKQKLGRVP